MSQTPEQIALERIDEADKTKSEKLDLSYLQLNTLPDVLWQLTNLTSLDLRNNQLSTLPTEISQLTNLTSLDLRNNQLSTLPTEISQLQNLTALVLRNNQFSTLPTEIAQLQNLTQLYLSFNQFSTLPTEISQLQNLTQLYLSYNKFSTLPTEIARLQNLTQLYLSGNQLSTLPTEIAQLQNLTQLDLSENQLSTLPTEVSQLQNLTQLDLSSNKLSALPLKIWKLPNLKKLVISYNPFSEFPSKLWEKDDLEKVGLGGLNLKTLPPEISLLTNLTQLDLSENQLSTLPTEISQLQNLTSLDLSENQLSTLPPEISQLQNLTQLYLSGNQLTSLPPEITQLNNLTELVLFDNQLTDLPPEIGQLVNLTRLYLQGNQLANLPLEIEELTNLTTLDLFNNQLNELPKQITELLTLETINLNDNPLEIAIPTKWLGSIYGGSEFTQEILAYYKQMHEEGGRSLGEARVLVVGEADAGKTKLLRALLYGEHGSKFKDTRDATEGIEISEMKGKDVNVRVWDFGGQEIMHATHRFFLSRRCAYVLVVDATVGRDFNQAKIEYWLELIKSYGGDSPVLLISSKSESFSLDINKNDLQEKYPNLVKGAVLATSAKSGQGIEELRSAIFEQAEKLPSVKVTLPRSFISVKDKIEKLKDKKKSTVIEEGDFRNLCKKNDIIDEERQNILLQLLHDMGVVLHYENDDRLSDFGILNPEWATAGVYKLVNNPKIKDTQGKFTLGEVKDLLQDEVAYPANMRRRIVDLMKKFELTYELPFAKDTYILPSALPANQPELKEWDGNTMAFEYQYLILRVGVLHRFMVKKHDLIQNEKIWYSGVVIANKDNQALIKADFGKKKILIKVKGKEETRKDFLYLIRMEFESIHGEESKPDEFVYHPKYPDLQLSFNEMKILAKTDQEHKTVYKGERVVINLRELLDGFITLEERRKDEEKEELEAKRMGKVSGLEKEHKGGDTYITHINAGDLEGSNISIGKGNQITQNLESSFNSYSPELQSNLIELMKLTEALLGQVKEDETKEEIKEELDDLQKQAKKSNPIKDKVKISVEGLAKAAKNLNEVGKPVLELATTIIKLINNLPA